MSLGCDMRCDIMVVRLWVGSQFRFSFVDVFADHILTYAYELTFHMGVSHRG